VLIARDHHRQPAEALPHDRGAAEPGRDATLPVGAAARAQA
jgi:hypothetical protein